MPPKWAYDKDDLRAFAKYEQKVRLWQIQVETYMSKREAALQLYNALTGEPEQELEHAPLDEINSFQWVHYILDQLRCPMEQRLAYQKRRLLADYEGISRYHNEHLRAWKQSASMSWPCMTARLEAADFLTAPGSVPKISVLCWLEPVIP